MERTQVILIRHGESIWNFEGRFQGHQDSPLSDTGISQAKALAQRLMRYDFDALYASDLGRALATAEIIAEQSPHTIITDARLRERNLGIFEGLHRDSIQNLHPEEYRLYRTSGPDYVIPDGESANQRFRRVIACIDELAREHHGGTIVMVSHGGVLDSLLRHALSIPLDVSRNFKLLNCSLNIFFCDNARWTLRTWGDVGHLESLRVLDDIYDLSQGIV